MHMKTVLSLLALLAFGIHTGSADECSDCIPVSTVHIAQLYNPCSDAGPADYCVDQIRKMTEHTILWPDGSLPERYYLLALGRSACAATCNKDWIGAPWLHRDCWPQFYEPIRSSRYYYAAAEDMTTDVIMAWCYNMAYVWGVLCVGPVGPTRYIGVDHLCRNCPSGDVDQDGYTSIMEGGNDCNDSLPFIHPNAAPICQFGFDADCDGILDMNQPSCIVNTPIILDVGKSGIALTGKADGVRFDLDSDGIKEQISWIAAGSDSAWLCLDRNGNGRIDDGTELFGNFTPQPDTPEGIEPNGFLALAVFDAAENGGNADAVIDNNDPVYRDLLLWQDLNHNGISDPGELSPLASSGITGISLDYKLSRKIDEYGNQFRYRSRLKFDKGPKELHNWAWDVILVR